MRAAGEYSGEKMMRPLLDTVVTVSMIYRFRFWLITAVDLARDLMTAFSTCHYMYVPVPVAGYVPVHVPVGGQRA